MNVERQRRRLFIALGITGLCALVALGAILATATTHQPFWLNLVVGAVVGGVGSQIWLIVGAMRDR